MKPKASKQKGFNHLKLVKSVELVELELINLDQSTQSRTGFHQKTLDDYVVVWEAGGNFPPVNLYFDGKTYWVADGFHRIKSRLEANLKGNKIEAIVHKGGKRDAILHSVGANSQHGLRRTNEDKRHAVELLLRDEEWSKWSNREIGRQCGVSHEFVANARKQLSGNRSQIERKVKRGGTVYTQRDRQTLPPLSNPAVSISKSDDLQEVISCMEGSNKPSSISRFPQGVCRTTGYSWDYIRILLSRGVLLSPAELENPLFRNCWSKAYGRGIN
ncbi:MAG: hypothetical protein KME25_34050 [Symplocastrum torsivum CPER-KK1]|jgi:hypothetical protein|uniref:ParB/Sulfiredoxin domain-containing protein n=1 Tax=Symplocastrum torsivum CPER-KK1 TaxID=450513 RepID=A0A951UF28_9CYAN|nr:hypothetical protein [Symplocastrum torsivum CPER-KK1]